MTTAGHSADPSLTVEAGSPSDLQRDVTRARRQQALLTLPAIVLLNLGPFGIVGQQLGVVLAAIGVILLCLVVRSAYQVLEAETQLLKSTHALNDEVAHRIGTGAIGQASEHWSKHRRRLTQVLWILVGLTGLALLTGSTVLKFAGPNGFAMGLLTSGLVIGWCLIPAAIWSMVALFKHRAAFIIDFQALYPATSKADADRAFLSVKADFWPLFK